MKVSFKLNLAQLARARAQVLRVVQQDAIDVEGDYYNGNIVGWVTDHGFSYNSNQKLELVDDCIVYTGERCPFNQDGMLSLLGELLTGEKKPSKGWEAGYTPMVYETSDQRLRWYETLNSFLYERGTIDDLMSHLRAPRTRWGDVTIIPMETDCVKNSTELLAAAKAVAGLTYHGRGSERTLTAAFNSGVLTIARMLVDNSPRFCFQ